MQLYRTLKRFADASVRHLDCWDVSITAPDPSFFEELPYALGIPADEVQHPLHCCLASVGACCCLPCREGRPCQPRRGSPWLGQHC